MGLLFEFILDLHYIKHGDVKMFNNFDTTLKADLRKKNSFHEQIEKYNLNIQACMVVLAVMIVLLLSVISIVTAQNPNFI